MNTLKKETSEILRQAVVFLIGREALEQKALAERVGIGPGPLNEALKGKRTFTRRTAEILAPAFGLDYDELLTLGRLISAGVPGEEALAQVRARASAPTQTAAPAQSFHSNVSPAPMPQTYARVPLISSVQAGSWSEAVDLYQPGDGEEWIPVTRPGLSPRSFALRVDGESMLPRFQPGDIVVVDPDMEAVSGDFVIAKMEEDVTFKQYRRDMGRDYLVPLNRDWGQPVDMTGKRWRIVGRVVQIAAKDL